MRPRVAARLALTWIQLPLALVLGNVYLASTFDHGDAYDLAEQVRGMSAGVLIHPVTALFACIAGLRLRASRLLRGTNVRRSWYAVFGTLVAPAALASTAALVAMSVIASLSVTGGYHPRPLLVALVLAQSTGYAALGAGLGLSVRPLVSAPASVVLPYVLIGFPPAMTPYWLRHLTSVSTSCCTAYEALAWEAVVAICLVSIALLLIGYAAFRAATPRPRRDAVAAAALSCALIVGAAVTARGLGPAPVVPRQGTPECTDVRGTQLCLWPEHEASRPAASEAIERLQGIASDTGAPLPSRFTELAPAKVQWPTAFVSLGSSADTATVLLDALDPGLACSLAAVGTQTAEPLVATPQRETSPSAILRAWWGGRWGEQTTPDLTPTERAALARIRALPPGQQGASIRELTSQANVCRGR